MEVAAAIMVDDDGATLATSRSRCTDLKANFS